MTDVETLRLRPDIAPGIWYGGDYNPEQWSLEVQLEDVELMTAASVNTATVGVFSWSSIEPSPGEYRFEWLDAVMDRLHEAGIRVILATPTASPPPWFTRLHPEAMPITAQSIRLEHGSRDTYNPAAPAYREAAKRITRVIAERYGTHPALAMWHLHNEYGSVSRGPVTDAAFRDWLRARYGTLENLNHTWNTAFWSQHYSDWNDITALAPTQYLPNPAHVLDVRRFDADMLLECLRDQVAIVRELTPNIPSTTNFILPTWNHLDFWAFAREIDIVSVDHYLDSETSAGEVHTAFAADLARSFNDGRPWMLMEHATSLVYDYAGGRYLVKEPGRMRRNTYQYLARGAMSSLFFQWRSPLVGAEFFHSAMVPHAGADTRLFREIAALGAELELVSEAVVAPAHGRVVRARVAIVWSADAWWSAETRAMPSNDIAFLPAVRAVHTALWDLGYVVDVVAPDGALDDYAAILVPSLLTVSDEDAARLAAFVTESGSLTVWHLAGTTDEHLRVRTGGYSGAFAEILGIRVEEHVPLRDETVITLSDGASAGSWSEIVHLAGAESVAEYTSDAHPVIGAGSPAITRHRRGTGVAHYLSTRLDDASLRAHLARILGEASLVPENPEARDGLEIVRRFAGASTYLFVINHSDQPRHVRASGQDLITSTCFDGEVLVDSGDVRVIRESTTASPATEPGH